MPLDKVIGIGCSAGGLDALEYLVPQVDLDNTAVLLFPHISHGMIFDRLSHTDVPIALMEHGMPIEEGCVYMEPAHIPKYCDFVFVNDRFLLHNHKTKRRYRASRPAGFSAIDMNFSYLAHAYGEHVTGAILSGCGNDGIYGLLMIQDAGGKTATQDEPENSSEEYLNALPQVFSDGIELPRYYVDSMPSAARVNVELDFSGPLTQMAHFLNNS